MRLQGLTQLIYGDRRPKQFCPLISKRTLLAEARQRAERSISTEKILYSVMQCHRDYYLSELWDLPNQLVEQPCNRGTAPAVLYSLLHVARLDPDAVVAILPCDHYYSRESVFTEALAEAFQIAKNRQESVVLLGAQPTVAEVDYGWIELGRCIDRHPHTYQVLGFHEKPPLPLAQQLFRRGCLWNTFVMVGHIDAFLALAQEAVPDLLQGLRNIPISPKTDEEKRIVEWLYDRTATADFSLQVLSLVERQLLT
ncbi:MAG: hypothetical protein B7Z55_06170, partial [Planctomycetales bacterium 12-60-4]